MRFIPAIVVTLFLACLAPSLKPAQAQLSLGTSCTVSAQQPMSFGSYTPFSPSAIDTATTVEVQCGGVLGVNIAYELQLSSGNGANVNNRHLINTTGVPTQLNYQAYVEPTRTVIWGDGTSGATFNGAFTIVLLGSNSRTHTAYGRMPGNQSPYAGVYSDDPVMTIIF